MADVKVSTLNEQASDDRLQLVELHDHLDDLWKRYLDLVDQYQQARKDVQKYLSDVSFRIIVKANRTITYERKAVC